MLGPADKCAALWGFIGSVTMSCAIWGCGDGPGEPVREFVVSFEMREPFEPYSSMQARVASPEVELDGNGSPTSRTWRYLGCERGPAVEDASFRVVGESGIHFHQEDLIVTLGAYVGGGGDPGPDDDSASRWPIVEALADPDLTVFQCNVESVERPRPGRFSVFPQDARDANGDRIDPLPHFAASHVVQVGGPMATTTTTVTSTPFQPVLTYLVQVGVTNDAGTLGALQFDLQAEGSAGGWQGAGTSVNCRFDVAAGLTQCNDKGSGRLTCALVDVSGFATPTPIVTCSYRSAETVSASDFSVVVVDAATVDLYPAEVTMGVVDIRIR